MQDRAEHLAFEPRRAVDLEGARREEGAVLGAGRQVAAVDQPGFALHPRGVRVQRLAAPPRRSPGRHRWRAAPGRRSPARPSRPPASSSSRSAMSSCTKSTRSAEQRCPALSKAEVSTSATTCSAQRRGIDDHRVLPAGLGDERHDRPGAARPASRLIARAVSVEPVKATPAMRGSATSGAPTASPVARQQVQHVARDPRPRAAAAPRRRRSAGSARRAWR